MTGEGDEGRVGDHGRVQLPISEGKRIDIAYTERASGEKESERKDKPPWPGTLRGSRTQDKMHLS